MTLAVTEIRRYPVKSCRGESLPDALVERQGLAGDRRYMIVDSDARVLTAREIPRMLLIRPSLIDGGVRLSAPERPDIEVSLNGAGRRDVEVWNSIVPATLLGADVDSWLSEYLGVSVQLAFQHDPASRRTNPRFSDENDRVSFADGYPLLVTTTASLTALNDWIAEGPLAEQGPLPMVRFRPNLVISGGTAWDEDGWRRLRIGTAEFRAVKGCDRCVMTTTDAESAARGKEPIATLARYRRWDGLTWFGMNLVPDNPGARIAVGDPVEILESVPAPDGPPR
ncbi:MAG TPA: MOSC N-terminal beta barrel domain-containing protein [Jatrophihabitantaceae bacterium]|nr:MOSC N-terminal beta barrel domain-containing protein [Jatrophihabitantaceae bacterium]